jgi:hypothetical protein
MRASAFDSPTMPGGSCYQADACKALCIGNLGMQFRLLRQYAGLGQTRIDSGVPIGHGRTSELVGDSTTIGAARGLESTVSSLSMLNPSWTQQELLPLRQATTTALLLAPSHSMRPAGSSSTPSRSCSRPEFPLLQVGCKNAETPPQLRLFAAQSPDGSSKEVTPVIAELAPVVRGGRRRWWQRQGR